MIGDAAEAAPFAHRHHEIQALFLRQQGGVAVLGPASVQFRRGGGDDPPTVGDGKKYAEFFGSFHVANFLCWRTRSRALRGATGRNTPNSALMPTAYVASSSPPPPPAPTPSMPPAPGRRARNC